MLIKEKIKNIIFDLGGVIINLDVPATWQAFQKLAVNHPMLLSDFDWQMDFLKQYEIGKISSAEFLDHLKKKLSTPIDDQVLIDAWNAMLLDIPLSRLQLLSALKKQYRIFLLSNTNELHYLAFHSILEKSHGHSSLSDFFHHAYYSHLIGKRKPDPETFQFVLDQQNLNPNETLFLDDTSMHLEGAAQTGIHTILVNSENPITTIFEPVLHR